MSLPVSPLGYIARTTVLDVFTQFRHNSFIALDTHEMHARRLGGGSPLSSIARVSDGSVISAWMSGEN